MPEKLTSNQKGRRSRFHPNQDNSPLLFADLPLGFGIELDQVNHRPRTQTKPSLPASRMYVDYQDGI
jgi:hypothetical protein